MHNNHVILAINPGSTSTKIAVFNNNEEIANETIRHNPDDISQYSEILDQYEFRKNVIIDTLNNAKFDMTTLSAIVGRGGLLRPLEGGTYTVNDRMLEDLKSKQYGEHASSLGAKLAKEIGDSLSIPSYIVDPVVVDEYEDVARFSGIPEIDRKSIFHALNQKAVARRAASELGKTYNEVNLVVAHLGGGISVGAHKEGRVIDGNNALDGEGPFTPERSGGVPVGALVKMCYSGNYTYNEIKKKITGKGGLLAYLGTSDGREVRKRIDQGDQEAEKVFKAMAYQTAKEIGAYATVLKGKVDAIVLTGGLIYGENIRKWIEEMVSYIAPVIVYPGEDEMSALAEGALRVLNEEEESKVY